MAIFYWGGGSGTWNSSSVTNWFTDAARTTPAATAPTLADDVDFGSASNATSYTVTIGTGAVCKDWTVAGPASGNVNFGGTGTLTIYGNTSFTSTGISAPATGSTYAITFAATTTVTLKGPNAVNLTLGTLTFNGVGGTWTLTGALTTAGSITLTNGTLDLNSNTLTGSTFSSNNSNTRSIAFGTGNITLVGTGTIWNTGTVTNFSRTGTPTVNISNNTATATTVTTGAMSETQSLDFNFTTGTYTLTDTSSVYRSLNFTGFSGTMSGSTRTIYGNLTFSSTMTITASNLVTTFAATSGIQELTTNNKTLTLNVVQNNLGATLRLKDNCNFPAGTSGNQVFALTSGNLDLNNFNLSTSYFSSSNSNVRSIAFGSIGSITILTNAGGASWGMATATNFSYTGTSLVIHAFGAIQHGSTAGGSEANALNFTLSGTSSFFTTGSYIRNLTTTSSFSGTITLNIFCYGDLSIGALTNFSSSTNIGYFSKTGGTQSIDLNGKTIDNPIAFNGTGTYTLVSNFTTTSSRAVALTSGTLNLNNKVLSCGTFSSTGSTTRSITFGTGNITITGSGTTAWNASGSALTTTGNGTISLTSASAKTFVGGGFNYAATLDQGGSGTLTITGNNTFAGLSDTVQPATITVTAGSTQSFTGAVTLAGTSGNLITLNSSTPGTRYTFNYSGAPVSSSLSFCSITDCIGYENAYWKAFQSNGCVNGGNNLGWLFAPTIYSAGFQKL